MQLNGWEAPAAPAPPLMACRTSRLGSPCARNATIHGPARFAPACDDQLRPGAAAADPGATAAGNIRCREAAKARPLPGCAYLLATAGRERPVHAYSTLNVSPPDAVTRRRAAGARAGGEG